MVSDSGNSWGRKEGREGGREGGRHLATVEHKPIQQGMPQAKDHLGDFPGGAVGKTPCSQCRGPGLNPWSGN